MARIYIKASKKEVEALNKLENTMTAFGLTNYPRRFILVDDELIVHTFESDESDPKIKGVGSGLEVVKELRSILNGQGWKFAEQLGLADTLCSFITFIKQEIN